MTQTLIVVTRSGAVIVFLPEKHTGPIPKNALAAEVVLRVHPLQSIAFVSVRPATVTSHPKGMMSGMVLVQASVVDEAHDVTVVVASTVGVGVAHPFERSVNCSSEYKLLE